MTRRLAVLTFLLAAAAARGAEYVPDSVCGTCHPAKYASYQSVGMAQSMRRPRAEALIEDFPNGTFVHEPTKSHYEMAWKDGKLLFRRYQLDAGGRHVNQIEQSVDWIVGSGHRSRVYLYRTPSGELYQLPIAWYTQERAWGMAPGYDRPDNDGITRAVRRECLFCHNAYPEAREENDAHWMPQIFPAVLPEGTGCQRCHGPGSDHVLAATDGTSSRETRLTIVNPAKLPATRREDVCFQCHLQPAVAMTGARRFDRGDYSFRPGQALTDYMLHVDIDEAGRSREQRFEINHHAYRLRQSPCYVKGGITCISCHDPHQPLKKDPRLANVTAVCLGCHQAHERKSETVAANDCVTCHMSRRRTQDVVRVVMTDHRIGRRPPAGDLLAPLAERDPDITAVQLLDGGQEIYRAVTVLRAMPRNVAATEFLNRMLPITDSPVPRFDLVAAYLQQKQFQRALDTLHSLGDATASDARLRDWRGMSEVGLGQIEAGVADLRTAAETAPGLPEIQFNLAAVLHRTGRDTEALPYFTRAIELRPTFVAALQLRAETLAALGRRGEAIADLRRALAVEPRDARAWLVVAGLGLDVPP